MNFVIFRYTAILLATIFALYLPSNPAGPHGGKFTFAVVGDLHGSGSIEVPEQFKTILKELNILRPDFIVSTGDSIEGYEDDEAQIRGEWDAWHAVVQGSLDGIPYYPTPGNHDAWSQLSEKLYKEIVAPLWYSFDYGDCHFVILCSADENYQGGIRPEELAWLEADLKANANAAHTFCFIHKPMWYKGQEDGWQYWYDKIQPILVKYGVDYFFSGHWHVYEDYGDVDGVHYIISGGAGGTLDTRRPDNLGPFYHYLLVTVDGDRVDVAVMKIGAVNAVDIVTSDMLKVYNQAVAIFAKQPVFEVSGGMASYKGAAKFEVANPFDAPITGTIHWDIPGQGWVINCPPNFRIDKNSRGEIPITITFNGNNPFFSEWPKYKATYKIPGVSDKEFTAEGTLRVVPVVDVPEAPGPIVIDGIFDDWANISALKVATREFITRFKEWRPEDLSMTLRLTWDADKFYIACEVTDDVHFQPYTLNDPNIWMGDGIMVGFDTANADMLNYGPNDFEIFFTIKDDQPLFQLRNVGENNSIKSGQGIEFAATREWEFTRYEIAIDKSAFPLDILHPDARLGFSILATDNDGDGWEGFIEWNPGALTYGKDLASFGTLVLVQ